MDLGLGFRLGSGYGKGYYNRNTFHRKWGTKGHLSAQSENLQYIVIHNTLLVKLCQNR